MRNHRYLDGFQPNASTPELSAVTVDFGYSNRNSSNDSSDGTKDFGKHVLKPQNVLNDQSLVSESVEMPVDLLEGELKPIELRPYTMPCIRGDRLPD